MPMRLHEALFDTCKVLLEVGQMLAYLDFQARHSHKKGQECRSTICHLVNVNECEFDQVVAITLGHEGVLAILMGDMLLVVRHGHAFIVDVRERHHALLLS